MLLNSRRETRWREEPPAGIAWGEGWRKRGQRAWWAIMTTVVFDGHRRAKNRTSTQARRDTDREERTGREEKKKRTRKLAWIQEVKKSFEEFGPSWMVPTPSQHAHVMLPVG